MSRPGGQDASSPAVAAFEGYTNGEDKARLGNLTSTGDMGRFEDGRLSTSKAATTT